MIPRDIVICDWHYDERLDYPSARIFATEGFRFWPSTWKNLKCVETFSNVAMRDGQDKCLGLLATTWIASDQIIKAFLGNEAEINALPEDTRLTAAAFKLCMRKTREMKSIR